MSKPPAERQPTVGDFLAAFRAAIALPRGGALRGGVSPRRALGVYVEVQADTGALEEPDDRLLDDFETVLPFALSELTSAGFATAVEAGTSALFTADRPADPDHDEGMRRGALNVVLALKRRLQSRPGRDPRVHVRLCVHVGELFCSGDGALAGGDLLELAGWVPEDAAEGVFASLPVLDGLGIAAQPAPASRGPSALLRVVDPKGR
jgi:eukaryotic-like serine/threonine-protein kinase